MRLLRLRYTKFIALFLFIIFSTTVVVAQFPLFKDGDRVCFIGNSITMDGKFHNYIELYYATRFPDRKIEFYNCGISGDVSGGILRRMDSDILIHQPNWAVLMIGMNDVNRSLYAKERVSEPGIKEKQQKTLDRYFKNVDSVVRILMDANSKVVLQTPSIYDQTAELKTPSLFGVNDALGQCAEFLKTLAQKYKLPVVDYWTSMNAINTVVQKNNPGATIVGQDRVHPGIQGHFVMAGEFLRTQQVPAYVSVMSIDARKHKITNTERCTLSDIRYDNSGISFSSLESSLPYPLLTKDFNPDSLFSFNSNLNEEILQIKSLEKGDYLLKIDSVVIGTYSGSKLKEGINLAKNTRTPQYRQSEKVLNLLNEYWGLIRKLRQIKYVEYQLMDNEMRQSQLTNENAKMLIEKRMEKFKGQPKEYIDFYRENFDEYLINKPMEKELAAKAEKAFERIYESNKPVNHLYKIVKK